jgi:hypothetical protein
MHAIELMLDNDRPMLGISRSMYWIRLVTRLRAQGVI